MFNEIDIKDVQRILHYELQAYARTKYLWFDMRVRCFILTLFSCCYSLFNQNKEKRDNNMYVISAPKKTNKTILISYQQAQIWIKNSNTYANVDAISILDGEACVFFIIRKFVEIRCRRKLNIFSRSNQNTSQRNTPFNNENVHDREKIYSENVIIFHMHVDAFAFQVRWTKVEPRHSSLLYFTNVEPSTSDSEMHFAISVSTQQIRLWLSDHLLKSASNMFCGIRVSIYFHKQLTAEIFHLNFDSSTRIIRF